MENANILTLFWASFLYTPSLKSLCKLLKRIWSYSSSSIFSSNLALFLLSRLRLRVFHTAVRYGKRHVKLIETSAEERAEGLLAVYYLVIIRDDYIKAWFHGRFFSAKCENFGCFFWIVSNQVEIIYSSSRNSKETGEIIGISPRKSARGIRPLHVHALYTLYVIWYIIKRKPIVLWML
jgi:hypothetical protein